MNIADIVMIVFIISMLLFGIFKGFVKMIIDLVSSLAAFIAAIFLSKTIASVIQDFPIFDGMKKGIQEFFTNNADLASKNVTQTVEGINLPVFVKNYILKDFPDPAQAINAGAQELADRVFYLMLLAIVGIILFIVIRIAFYFLEMVFEKTFNKIRILDAINKIFGGIFGVANAILILYVVLAIAALLASRMPTLMSYISDSAIVSKLYYNNLLMMLLT